LLYNKGATAERMKGRRGEWEIEAKRRFRDNGTKELRDCKTA